MSWQRRRGLPATVYKTKVEVDNRGNEIRSPDSDGPYQTKAWIYPQRSSKAQVPGQQVINVIQIGVPVQDGIDLWSRVDFVGKTWDLVAPPEYHHGTRHTRHYSLMLRERPTGG